jgi:hypothetical protein
MNFDNYRLDIINKFENKKYQKHNIEEQETIGVYEDEPFEIVLRNNTYERIQVRFSIDGTDILTGELANTDTSGKMWLVEPYGSITLSAWPETNEGGAKFIFTDCSNSVAANTHKNILGKGFIAAAVFKQDKPIKKLEQNTKGILRIKSFGVGAGEYIDQKIVKTAGLTNPVLDEILTIKYESWSSLRYKLRTGPNPFPGDLERNINLTNVPKIIKKKEPKYFDFARLM